MPASDNMSVILKTLCQCWIDLPSITLSQYLEQLYDIRNWPINEICIKQIACLLNFNMSTTYYYICFYIYIMSIYIIKYHAQTRCYEVVMTISCNLIKSVTMSTDHKALHNHRNNECSMEEYMLRFLLWYSCIGNTFRWNWGFNTLEPRQNGEMTKLHFADDIFKCLFNEKYMNSN